MVMYHNGTISLERMKQMVLSPKYKCYIEYTKEIPPDWNFLEDGFCRGNLKELKSLEDLSSAMNDFLFKESTFCVEYTDEYFKENPYPGESASYVKPVFSAKYAGSKNYELREYDIYNTDKKGIELIQYFEDFESSCFTIGYWHRDSEGYYFESVGSRFFELPQEDLEKLWPMMKAADKYLADLYSKEEDN